MVSHIIHTRFWAIVSAIGLLLLPVPCLAGAGATMFTAFVQQHIIDNALFIFGPIATAALFFYGYKTIVESHNESALTDASKSFVNALIGFAVIALAIPFTTSVRQTSITPLLPGVESLIAYIVTAAGGIFVLMMTIHGIQLVASGGDSGQVEKLKKGIATNIAGAILMLIARSIVASVAGNDLSFIAIEIAGFARYMLGIIGVVSVLAFIFAGVLLVVSVDESLKDRAKKTVTGTLISLVIVIGCYSLIATLFG